MFKYKSNDWKEICEFINRWWHEQGRTRSSRDHKNSNKK